MHQVNTTHTFYVFHRQHAGGKNYSNAHFMFSKDHPQYRRKDWLHFHSTSKAWSGKFGQIPANERVGKPKAKRKKRTSSQDDDDVGAFQDDDVQEQEEEDDKDEGDGRDTEESIVKGAEAEYQQSAKLFRREQIPSRYLIDMLLRYGRAWTRQPAFRGIPAERVVVFDPFCGSCSTARAAWATDCNFIGFDIDPLAKTLFQGDADNTPKTTTWARMVERMKKFPKVCTCTTQHSIPASYAAITSQSGLRSLALLRRRRQEANIRFCRRVRRI